MTTRTHPKHRSRSFNAMPKWKALLLIGIMGFVNLAALPFVLFLGGIVGEVVLKKIGVIKSE